MAKLLTVCVELCESVEQHDQQVIGCLLPVVKQRLDEATRALSGCLEVKDIAVHWYYIISCILVSFVPCFLCCFYIYNL